MTDAPDVDATEVDARGRRCPQPVIDLARAARGLEPGDEIVLLADDPAAPADVAAWCRMRGHLLLADEPAADGARALRVRLGAAAG